jgi:hypothetical protein
MKGVLTKDNKENEDSLKGSGALGKPQTLRYLRFLLFDFP